jgi:hypothetical protein
MIRQKLAEREAFPNICFFRLILFFVSQNETFFPNRPALFLVHKQPVKRIGRLGIHLDPGFAPVIGSQDGAGGSDYPSGFVIGEKNAKERFGDGRVHSFPIHTAVFRS